MEVKKLELCIKMQFLSAFPDIMLMPTKLKGCHT